MSAVLRQSVWKAATSCRCNCLDAGRVSWFMTAKRGNSTAASESTAGTSSAGPSEGSKRRPRALTQEERDFLSSALRVNQAGELGANLIYAGQYAVLKHDPRMKPLIRHMWDQEVHHLKTFNTLMADHRVRPTALRPLWNVMGYAIGYGTAMMGEKAAMACTEAVETEIGMHYNDQLRTLLQMVREGELGLDNLEVGEKAELAQLMETIKEFRDDELEHLDTAVEHDSKGAPAYDLLTSVIRGGCKAAIWLSKRV